MQLVQATFERTLGDAILPGYRLACAMLHDATEAEDVVQEGHLMPWFLGIMANECRGRRRQRWWSVVRVGDLAALAGAAAPAPEFLGGSAARAARPAREGPAGGGPVLLPRPATGRGRARRGYLTGRGSRPALPGDTTASARGRGTWKFVVHNPTKGRLAWALELAAVPGTAAQPLALGTYDGSVPNLIGTVIPLAVVPGHRSITVTLANGHSELLVSVASSPTAAQLIHDRVTFTLDVPDGTACCYALVLGSGPMQDRHPVPITITYA
jgi:hypothetical protein